MQAIKSIAQITGLAVALLIAGWVGWLCRDARPDPPAPLPTIEEIQRRIGAKPDGILGPETQAKWERAICDSYARGER